jgi:hypothetical protein
MRVADSFPQQLAPANMVVAVEVAATDVVRGKLKPEKPAGNRHQAAGRAQQRARENLDYRSSTCSASELYVYAQQQPKPL